MDGIAAVTARIGEIQGLMATISPSRAPSPAAAPAARADFAATLEQARATTSAFPTSAFPSTAFPSTAFPSTAFPSTAFPTAAPTTGSLPSPAVSTARRADGVPLELAAYGNGKVPASALTPIGRGDHRLWAPAAEGFRALEQAAAEDGVTIKVTDSYRSYESQVDVARRKGLYSEGGLAAKPGTSEHGWGLSVDLSLDGRAQAWMRTNGARFGFEENVPREPWHWTYTAGR